MYMSVVQIDSIRAKDRRFSSALTLRFSPHVAALVW